MTGRRLVLSVMGLLGMAACAPDVAPRDVTVVPAAASAQPTTATKLASAMTDPQQLVGSDPARIGAIMGTPQHIRHEKSLDVWQYSNARCMLEFYLWHQSGQVIYIEARDRQAIAVAAPQCMRSLLEQKSAS
ncbi:MAG TPA: hypothetical protein VHL08_06505 [Dongiaceae bacterium]|jgi:hypothetical protein|nr:hypothetical protein [Dongiaceae bacterium]